MWIIMIAFSVAIANIAGNNTALVPDMTSVLGNKIYITTIGAYCIFGSIISGLTAWLGITSGCELVKIAKNLYGNVGKKAAAIAILSICVPASALTGGFL